MFRLASNFAMRPSGVASKFGNVTLANISRSFTSPAVESKTKVDSTRVVTNILKEHSEKARFAAQKAQQKARKLIKEAKQAEKDGLMKARYIERQAVKKAREAEQKAKKQQAALVAREEKKKREESEKTLKKLSNEETKKYRDSAPVRIRTPFTFFVMSHFQSARVEGQSAPAALKTLSQQWKALSEEEKKTYEAQHVADKERFAQEKLKFENEYKIPKRPMSAYNLYYKSRIGNFISKGAKLQDNLDQVRRVASEWKVLTPEQKAPFLKQAEELSAEYQREVQVFKQQHPFLNLKKQKKKEQPKPAQPDDVE